MKEVAFLFLFLCVMNNTWRMFVYVALGAFGSPNVLENLVCLEATYFKRKLIQLTNAEFRVQMQRTKNDVVYLNAGPTAPNATAANASN